MDFGQIKIKTVLHVFLFFYVLLQLFNSRLPLYVLFITKGGYFYFVHVQKHRED